MPLLDVLDHLDRELCFGVLLSNLVRKAAIDRITSTGHCQLVGLLGHRAVHAAQVDRARSDVDDEHVVEHVEAVSHGKRLGAQHHRVHRFASRL